MTITTSDHPAVDAQYKNVVVIGGSCAGVGLCVKLRDMGGLPSPYRVVLVEKHSHMHYMYTFPRASVVAGFEKELFAPYNNIFGGDEARGVFVQGTAESITATHIRVVVAGDGASEPEIVEIPYSYLIYAAGTTHPEPCTLSSHDTKTEALAALSAYQARIAAATSVVVVGGGAAGIELAAEIREHYPSTAVTLVHSRASYLPDYKPELAEAACAILDKFGVVRVMEKRVDLSTVPEWAKSASLADVGQAPIEVKATDGSVLASGVDLVLLCTGMKPNSDALATLSPQSVDEATKFVKVRETLQIEDSTFGNVYAVGNVAKTTDVKMGYVAWGQARHALDNVVADIQGSPLKPWTRLPPQMFLYLGMNDGAGQVVNPETQELAVVGADVMRPYFSHNLGANRIWDWVGTSMSEESVDL
ncbi:hypothetical protein H9P43_000315 [Blastocladiella emersonii ATCC 22665]|nr:hypothetical protein H9P43_000315 [Blastocladiella emersonii ATCC 22665]